LELASKAIRAREPAQALPVLMLIAGWLLQEGADVPAPVAEKLRALLKEGTSRLSGTLSGGDAAAKLAGWLAEAALSFPPETLCAKAEEIFKKMDPAWRPGRDPLLPMADWQPVTSRVLTRWMVAALHTLPLDAPWAQSLWRLQRSQRPQGALIRPLEWDLLMQAAAAARQAGSLATATRLTALAVHLLPERAPQAQRQRAAVAAWFLAERGIAAPQPLAVSLDELPYPGDPPGTEPGQEATRLFRDEADAFQNHLRAEVETDADWQTLKAGGIPLHHPMAALAWVGRRAQAYWMKKQTDLLRAAARLALRYGALGTLARIRAEMPESPTAILDLARALRECQRSMPVLRDGAEWRRITTCLRAAWARLESEAALTADEEALFLMHETLLDQQATLHACLPETLRALSAEHATNPRAPSALVRALDEVPKLMRCLEHQRAVELWSIAAELRARPDSADLAWISVVSSGPTDAQRTRASWMVQTAAGRRTGSLKLRAVEDRAALMQSMAAAAGELCPAGLQRVRLACDLDLPAWPGDALVSHIPSWEAAFREMRAQG
jgi:hypothetical protein